MTVYSIDSIPCNISLYAEQLRVIVHVCLPYIGTCVYIYWHLFPHGHAHWRTYIGTNWYTITNGAYFCAHIFYIYIGTCTYTVGRLMQPNEYIRRSFSIKQSIRHALVNTRPGS